MFYKHLLLTLVYMYMYIRFNKFFVLVYSIFIGLLLTADADLDFKMIVVERRITRLLLWKIGDTGLNE